MKKLVTVATFDFVAEAEARKLLLEQNCIQTFLADNNLVGMDWFISNAVGGAKLQVGAADVDRARAILDANRPAETTPHDVETAITFACQDCGKAITYPGERRGHVETCPSCGSYVDVPEETDASLVADATTTERATQADVSSRTNAQVWFEVVAVLCLAYLPYLYASVIAMTGGSLWTADSLANEMLDWIVSALRTSLPLLAILALTKEPWSAFGIVRPKWIVELPAGVVIGFCGIIAYLFALSLLPASMLETPYFLHSTQRMEPDGIPEYVLVLFACAIGGFTEELVMRGYLIPRLERLLRSTWIAVLTSSLLFASYHLYQGWTPAIGDIAVGLLYGVTFCLFRRLWPLCIGHALANFMLYF